MRLADCYSASRVWGPLASSGHGPVAGELFRPAVAGSHANLRIADADKSWAVLPDTAVAKAGACLGRNCGLGASCHHVSRRNAVEGTTAIAATVDINGTDLGSMAEAAFSRIASTSWVMEGFAGFPDWRHILSIMLGYRGAPCSGSPSATEGARSAASTD